MSDEEKVPGDNISSAFARSLHGVLVIVHHLKIQSKIQKFIKDKLYLTSA